MEKIKHASTYIVVALFLAGLFVVPGLGVSSATHLQDTSIMTTQSNTGNLVAGLPKKAVLRVALYHETNTTRPTYVPTGGLNSNYSAIYSVLVNAGFEVHNVTFQDILNHELTMANYDVLVLADNCPRENISNLVKGFWLAGGGILGLDSAISYLGYYGILYRESEAVNDGSGAYWSYNFNDNATIVNRHPVTQSYANGTELRFMNLNWAQVNLTAFATTSVWPDTTVLAVDSQDPSWGVAVAVNPEDKGGRVVQIGMPVQFWPSGWNPMIVDAINWLAPMPKARIAFDLSHSPLFGIDTWDPVANHVLHYTEWRNLMVSEGYTVDKFYPSAQGNLTAQRLADYDILVEALPTIDFTTAEVEAVQTWVANGHGLLAMGDNTALNDYNAYINHLLSSLPLNISMNADGPNAVSTFNNPNEPTTEGVAGVYFATPGLINYSSSAVPLVGFAANQITAAAYQHVSGRVILASDINWIEDIYFLTHYNKQFASNVIDWLSVRNGDILIYTDSPLAPNFFRTPLALALDQLGLHFYLTSNSTYTNISLWYQDWSLVVIAEMNYDVSSIYSSLKDYIDQGGRLLMEAWNLDAYPNSPLWAALGAKFVQDWQGMAPAYIWQTGSPIFNIPVHYDAPTLNQTIYFSDLGDRVSVFDNATALAGSSTAPSENGAAIVLRNDGQTLLNTFIIDGLLGDADDSAYVDAFELWINEVAFMMRPEMSSPPDITYEAGTTGHAVTWTGTSRAPATFEIDVNGTMKQSGSWNGSSVTYNVDGLNPGNYSVTLTLADTLGEDSQDTVLVMVMATTQGPFGIDTTTLILIGIGVLLLIIIAAALSRRRGSSKKPAPKPRKSKKPAPKSRKKK